MAIKKIGKIVNYFGLKGMLKVSVTSSTPLNRFAKGKTVLIPDENGENQSYKISVLQPKDSRIIHIGLEGFDDINSIQSFLGKDIFANVRAPKGTYFFDELIGMEVKTDKGESLGKVDHIEKMPKAEYLVIDDKIYIPFLLDQFIASVNKKSKVITLTELGSEASKQ